MLDNDSFEEFRDPVTYDLECDAFDGDFTLIDAWAQQMGSPLLDLACGTGRMSIRLALQGYAMTGVDIVPEMIAHARKKAAARGASVQWVVGDARDFHLGRQFAGIFMIMNAFQFLPEREDHEGLFACVREHLQPGGQFLFETRNPSPRNLFGVRHPDGDTYTTTDGARLVTTSQQHYDPMTQIQHYLSNYQWTYPNGEQRERVLRTGLRYVFPQEMEALLHYNGFRIHTVYGDWQQHPLTAESPAMIYICERRGT